MANLDRLTVYVDNVKFGAGVQQQQQQNKQQVIDDPRNTEET